MCSRPKRGDWGNTGTRSRTVTLNLKKVLWEGALCFLLTGKLMGNGQQVQRVEDDTQQRVMVKSWNGNHCGKHYDKMPRLHPLISYTDRFSEYFFDLTLVSIWSRNIKVENNSLFQSPKSQNNRLKVKELFTTWCKEAISSNLEVRINNTWYCYEQNNALMWFIVCNVAA